ncbi:hypothetical protein BZA77DRAFT_374808, partial [Pyronema omphalodes]
ELHACLLLSTVLHSVGILLPYQRLLRHISSISTMPMNDRSHTLTPSERSAFFSGTIGVLLSPSADTPKRRRQHIARPLRNPAFLAAILDEQTLSAILKFNSSSLHLLGSKHMMHRLQALQRDPEYITAYLSDSALVSVLAEFWRCWENAAARAGCDSGDMQELLKEKEVLGEVGLVGKQQQEAEVMSFDTGNLGSVSTAESTKKPKRGFLYLLGLGN